MRMTSRAGGMILALRDLALFVRCETTLAVRPIRSRSSGFGLIAEQQAFTGGAHDDDLFSCGCLWVASSDDQDLFRQAASASPVPVEIVDADGAALRAVRSPAASISFISTAHCRRGDRTGLSTAARGGQTAVHRAPGTAATAGKVFDTDALAGKPSRAEEAGRWSSARSACGYRAAYWWSTIPRPCAASCEKRLRRRGFRSR